MFFSIFFPSNKIHNMNTADKKKKSGLKLNLKKIALQIIILNTFN